MKNYIKVVAAVSLVAGSSAVFAELSGNIGVTNNYLFRGVTQTADRAAVQGGLDYSHESGFYLGAWTSNLAASQYELDLYGGYAFDAGPVGLDVGVISYQYPVSPSDYYNEVYLTGSFNVVSFGAYYTFGSKDDDTAEFSSGDIYLNLGADFEVGNGVGIGLFIGSYMFDDSAGDDYIHYGASVSKSDFSLAIEKNDKDGADGDPRVVVSWGKSFDL